MVASAPAWSEAKQCMCGDNQIHCSALFGFFSSFSNMAAMESTQLGQDSRQPRHTVNRTRSFYTQSFIINLLLGWQNRAEHTYGMMLHTNWKHHLHHFFYAPPHPSPHLSATLPSRILKVLEEGPPTKSLCECFMHCYRLYQSFPASAHVTGFS